MDPSVLSRPLPDEYPAVWAPVVALVPDGDLGDWLQRDLDALVQQLSTLPIARGTFRYAPGKWSINDVLAHVIDCERIYTYRALRWARGDQTPLAGFDQDAYVEAASADARSLLDLMDELTDVRSGTVAFWRTLDPKVTLRRGLANGHEVSVRAMAYVTAGHGRHHQQLLRDRYGIGGMPLNDSIGGIV
jgi:hypothetical protein